MATIPTHRALEIAVYLENRGEREARLSPNSARIAAQALRLYLDVLQQLSHVKLEGRFRLEAGRAHDYPIDEVICETDDSAIAYAAYMLAVEKRPGRYVRLMREKTVVRQNHETRKPDLESLPPR